MRYVPAAAFAVAAAGLAVAPGLAGPAGLSTLLYLTLYAGFAQSWNLASGFGGQASLGHAAFLGAEAYAASIAMLQVAMLVMTITGDGGTVVGPIAGAFVVYYLIQQQLLNYPTLSAVLSGVLLIAVVRFTRDGIWGALCAAARRLTRELPEEA